MGIESLLESLKSDVSAVEDKPNEISRVSHVTPCKTSRVSEKNNGINQVSPETPVTPKEINSETHTEEKSVADDQGPWPSKTTPEVGKNSWRHLQCGVSGDTRDTQLIPIDFCSNPVVFCGVARGYKGLQSLVGDWLHEVAKTPSNGDFESEVSNKINCISPVTPKNTNAETQTVAKAATGDSLDNATESHRLWLIHHADRSLVSHSFIPPACRGEVNAWYPGSIAIEIEAEEDEVEDASSPHTPPATATPLQVACADCRHYRPDPVCHGGLGQCLADAPESKRIGSLWSGSRLFCSSFEAPAIERDNDKVSP